MNRPPLLSVIQAAEALGLSEQRVRALAASGAIDATKIGGRWLVNLDGVERLRSKPSEPGRPYSPDSAWGYLWLLSGKDPEWLSPWSRSRLLHRFRSKHPSPSALRGRAKLHRLYVHPGVASGLASDPRLVLSGASAASARRIDVINRDEVEAYVPRSDLDDLVTEYKLSLGPRHNVILRAVDGRWPFVDGERIAPEAVIALDLLESDDDRSRRAGRRLLDELIARTP